MHFNCQKSTSWNLFFKHLVPIYVGEHVDENHLELFLKEEKVSLPMEPPISMQFRGQQPCWFSDLHTEVEGHGGDTHQRVHSLICP